MARKRQGVRPVDAAQKALGRELRKREADLKPIEVVKIVIAAYQAHGFAEEATCPEATPIVESPDSAGLRRGTQAAIDRALFNANYWRAAYEQRIISACDAPEDALQCLRAVSVWTAHTLKLNTLTPSEALAVFERFCPPFKLNNRRGSRNASTGKGPLPDLERAISAMAGRAPDRTMRALRAILGDMEAEAAIYERLNERGPLNALFDALPAWCLQNRIPLVSGTWWEDRDVMDLLISALHDRFRERGFGDAVCQYFVDSCYEALDAYHRDLTGDAHPSSSRSMPELMGLVQTARKAQPTFETDGYGKELPSWLISKEQLIWNVVVCALYGPASARPLLVDSPDLLGVQDHGGATDVITELARISFARYDADRVASQTDTEFATFASLPADLRDSSIAYISSIHAKLETLGYEALPAGSCYPERCVTAFTTSETECLAILEHRRWLKERQRAGWSYGEAKDVEARRSPYMVPWEELPDRAKEWNRSAVRSIPALLASANLAIVR